MEDAEHDAHIRALKNRQRYLKRHTKTLEKAGITHGYNAEMRALDWAIGRLSEGAHAVCDV